MNGRLAKKVRKVAEVNVQKTYVDLIQSLMNLPDNVQDIVDKFNAQDIVDKRSLTIK